MAEETPKKGSKTSTKSGHADGEESTIFDPCAGLSEEQLTLRDQLEASGLAYAQDDREKAWLTDMCLLRYLRAREWKLEKAEKMLKATMDWRREWGVEDIRKEDVILTLELKSLYRNGKDQHGRPIMFIKPSYNGNTVEYRLKSLIYSLEECIESMDAAHGIEKMCLIADFDTESKLQKKSPDQTTVAKNFLNFLQNHYPERLGIAFALNPPWYIRLLYSIISPWMDPVTKKKIHFVNGSKDHIKKELLKYIDEDQLEQCYGGLRSMDGDGDVRNERFEREEKGEASSSATTEAEATIGEKKKRKKKKSKPTGDAAEGKEDAEEHPKIEDASELDKVPAESVEEATVHSLEDSMKDNSDSEVEAEETAEKKKKNKKKSKASEQE